MSVAEDKVPDGVDLGAIDAATWLAPQLVTTGITSRASNRVRTSGTVEHPHNGARGQLFGERTGRVVYDPYVQHGGSLQGPRARRAGEAIPIRAHERAVAQKAEVGMLVPQRQWAAEGRPIDAHRRHHEPGTGQARTARSVDIHQPLRMARVEHPA